MDPSTAQTVQDLIAQGKSREDIVSALVAKGMSVSSAADLLDVMIPNPAAPATVVPTPTPAAQPVPVVPVASAPAVTPPPAPTPAASPAPVSTMPLAAPTETQAKPKKLPIWIAVLGTLVFIAVAAAVVLILFDAQPAKFKTVSYSNGEGSQFKLSFYSPYTIQKVFTVTPQQSSSTGENANFTGLFAQKGLYGKAPLALAISSTTLTGVANAGYASYAKCSNSALPLVATVRNNYLKTSLNICAIRASGTPVLELTVFKDASKFYIATFTQKTSSTPQSSANNESEVGLSPYQPDIEAIVASIRVTTP